MVFEIQATGGDVSADDGVSVERIVMVARSSRTVIGRALRA
jgi:hypothetical protein